MLQITNSLNFNKIDEFNARGCSTALQDVTEPISVIGYAVGTDTNIDTGEIQSVAFLKDVEGRIYSTISKTAIETIADLGEMPSLDHPLTIEVVLRSSKKRSGAVFITLRILANA